MQIVRHYQHTPEQAQGAVVTLGNFDGIHKGHQAVIAKAQEVAKQEDSFVAAITFEPHPLTILRPEIAPLRINSFRQKIKQLEKQDVKVVFPLQFNPAFSKISAAAFVDDILVKHLAIKHVVIGHDFIFGHKRQGNAEFLQAKSQEHGFGFTQLHTVKDQHTVCSSSCIRTYLQEGKIEEANEMLARPFIIEGRVFRGEGRGKKLGFPTANILLRNRVRPAFGVYATHVRIEGDANSYMGIANIGVKPTFGTSQEQLEVYLFDYEGNLYDKRLSVECLTFIRPEKKFTSVEELQGQIQKDCEQVQQYLQKNEVEYG